MNFILHSPGDSMSNSGFFFFPTGYTLLVLYFPLQWELSMYSLNLQQMKVQNPNLKIFFFIGTISSDSYCINQGPSEKQMK